MAGDIFVLVEHLNGKIGVTSSTRPL